MNFTPTNNNQEGASFDDLRLDDAAFEALFKKLYRSLCVFCKFQYGFDIHLAEDVVNTCFVRLWEVRQTLAADVSPKAYLYTTIKNASLNIIKHEKVKQQHTRYLFNTMSESIAPGGFDSVDLKQLRADIDTAISALPEQMRRIFELSRFEDLKYAEIAGQLNISVKTVETQMSRALAKLRQSLSGYLVAFMLIFLLLLSL